MSIFKIYPCPQDSFYVTVNCEGILSNPFRTKFNGTVVPLSASEWASIVRDGEQSACKSRIGPKRQPWRVDVYDGGTWTRHSAVRIVARPGCLGVYESTTRV